MKKENLQEKILIGRSCSCYRPYKLFDAYVTKIVFYNENGVILERGAWLEKHSMDVKTYYTGIDIENITIVKPVKKIKENLKAKYNYYMTTHDKYTREKQYILYLYIDNKNIKIEEIAQKTCIEESLNTTIYTKNLTYLKISGMTPEPFTTIKVDLVKTEKTNACLQAEKILEIIKNNNIYVNLSIYDLTKLLQVFNIEEKENI